MKPLTIVTGEQVLLDDEDYERISKFRWYLCERAVKRTVNSCYKHYNIPISKEILNQVGNNEIFIDHKDRNPLNNQKENLRYCTYNQNMANRVFDKTGCASKYRGVDWRNDRGKWRVICGGRYVGLFEDSNEAAKAYDKKALEMYGEFAVLNFPTDTSNVK